MIKIKATFRDGGITHPTDFLARSSRCPDFQNNLIFSTSNKSRYLDLGSRDLYIKKTRIIDTIIDILAGRGPVSLRTIFKFSSNSI